MVSIYTLSATGLGTLHSYGMIVLGRGTNFQAGRFIVCRTSCALLMEVDRGNDPLGRDLITTNILICIPDYINFGFNRIHMRSK